MAEHEDDDDADATPTDGDEADGEVTFGEAFGVQPFGNSLVTMTLTGAQIYTLLEQQWVGQDFPRILQVSDGVTYTWDAAQPDGSKIVAGSVEIGGVAVDPGSGYRVTVNSFLADGGDNFGTFAEVDPLDRIPGPQDIDALTDYLGDNSPVAPPPTDRVNEALDTGLYVGNLWYTNFSDRAACRTTGMTRFATFWVEDGDIVAPVDVLRFDEALGRLLKRSHPEPIRVAHRVWCVVARTSVERCMPTEPRHE